MSTVPTPSPSTALTKALTASLVVAPVLSLIADTTYAARGWTDATAGVLHVLGAVAYGFVVIAVVAVLGSRPRLATAVLVTGLIGMAGNVAYGFDTIHTSLGDVALVHQPGAANLIKPLGLCFPLSLAVIAVAVVLLDRRWQGVVILIAAIGWPVAHIANIAPLAVGVNVLVVVAFGMLVRRMPLAVDESPRVRVGVETR